ncbi:uncharacterized protein L969DRAFT_95630 [Mixia osmundae IAM 14324]|uniref:uncharacterized protein n=1 Tax=Mixia osmundae (strain CBS 9802 / IAM 14324 / JCM 22182 / KY 12970) TaxID=764103 RepID=UPI0004A549CD|nr:uncharacterized protein L969DRAFT_95630 [Mixia osmundae IAM 14324]KEI38555.1 hypothetical protein L969DRAFT_95630 [Mixia osmundae IAM 14324]
MVVRPARWTDDYLDQEHLLALREYRYSAVDLSPVSRYILRPWWEWVAARMPIWLAPNAITLIGFMAIVFNVICVIVFLPDLEGPAPAILYFRLMDLTDVDGKQARKTGTSSPLGELFDHGIDSLNCALGGLVQAAAVGMGHTPLAAGMVVLACWPMYLSAWEEYHTGTLYLGVINGPTEGLLLAMGVMLISAFQGPWFWQTTADEALPGFLSSMVGADTRLEEVFMILVLLALFVGHAPACLYNVYQVRNKHNLPYFDAVYQIMPMLVFTTSSLLWIISPYSSLLVDEYMVEFALLLCPIFGQISTKIILAHLTKGEFPMITPAVWPLVAGCILVNLPILGLPELFTPILEQSFLHIGLAVSALTYTRSSLEIVDRFCSFLEISCLSIPYPGKPPAQHRRVATMDRTIHVHAT